MKQFAYAILAALFVAAVAHARTIVLPVRPVAIDANGAEVPELFVQLSNEDVGWMQGDGYIYQVYLLDGTRPSGPSCLQISTNNFVSCPSLPALTGPTYPCHVELR